MELIQCSNLPGEHWYSILHIRNENRKGFGDSSLISVATHHKYMVDNFQNYFYHLSKNESITENRNPISLLGNFRTDIFKNNDVEIYN